MADDALESVLRLVADGRLTADEARPILDALASQADADATVDTDADAGPSVPPATSPGGGRGRAIRLEVREGGKKVLHLRVPVALGRMALGQVPGLSDNTAQRIRDAIDAGMTGPILDIDEGTGDGVRVVIE